MLKKLPVFIILFVLLFSVLSQAKLASAVEIPLTSPITAPATPPLTSANLIGKVVHRQLFRLFGNAQRLIPADGVEITVKNLFNKNQTFETSTDTNGAYALQVPQGTYLVEVDDNQTFYAPPLKIVSIKNSTKRADFQGLIFPTFGR